MIVRVATAHLIYGYLGSGKSTYARQLSEKVHGVYISLDDWYLRLFTDGTPTARQEYELLGRLSDAMSDHWPQIVGAGAAVVLDFGFWTRASRDEARRLALTVGSQTVLHWIRCDDEIALARCVARNDDPHASFVIDAAAYEALKMRYEELDPDEDRIIVDT